jgi:membrane-associated phospholipid phosphatase
VFLPDRQRLDHPVRCEIEPATSKNGADMTSPTTRLMPRSSDGVGIFRRAGHPARLLGVASAVFALLVVMGIALRPGQDLGLARALNGLHTGAVGAVASAIYTVFEPVPSVVLTALLAAVIWIVRDLRTGAAFAGVVALTWIPSEMIKVIVHRGRPDIHLMPHPFLPVQTDPSFPSGHTAFIVALVLALAFVVHGTRWHPIVVGAGMLLIVLVALALAVDAVHYPTDIVASVAWSLAIAPAARLVWVDWVMPRVPGLAFSGAATGSPRIGTKGAQDDAHATTTSEPTED